MRKKTIRVIVLFAVGAGLALAQKKVKSPKEQEAIQAIQKAQGPDDVIKAVENLVTKFADTDYKSEALLDEAEAYDQKGDFIKAISNGELAIEADPKNFSAQLLVATELAGHTKDTDLDKAEKLARAEKYVKDAQASIPEAAKPNAQVTDAQWEAAKKDAMARSHFALGLIAMARKKPDVAATEYKMAVDGAVNPDQVWMVRLVNAYNLSGKQDDAIAVADKLLAMPDINPQVKAVAQSEKQTAEKSKGGKK